MEEKNNTENYIQFWQCQDLKYFNVMLKIKKWRIQAVLSLVSPDDEIRFATVGGYDQNYSYQEHGNWMGDHSFREPVSEALKIYRLKGRATEISRQIEETFFDISRFAFEDSSGVFYQGRDNGMEMCLQVSLPNSKVIDFGSRLVTQLPELYSYYNLPGELNKWYVLNRGKPILCFPEVSSFEDFRDEKLRPILESMEGHFYFDT